MNSHEDVSGDFFGQERGFRYVVNAIYGEVQGGEFRCYCVEEIFGVLHEILWGYSFRYSLQFQVVTS